jgi:hypothetical protein
MYLGFADGASFARCLSAGDLAGYSAERHAHGRTLAAQASSRSSQMLSVSTH